MHVNILTNVCIKFDTIEVFSHSSSEGADVCEIKALNREAIKHTHLKANYCPVQEKRAETSSTERAQGRVCVCFVKVLRANQ